MIKIKNCCALYDRDMCECMRIYTGLRNLSSANIIKRVFKKQSLKNRHWIVKHMKPTCLSLKILTVGL